MTRQSPIAQRVLALLTALFLALYIMTPATALAQTAAPTPAPTPDTYDETRPDLLAEENIEGTAAIAMDYETGIVLFAKNPDKKMYPASTTKIMTLILALEYGHLEDIVTIPQEAKNIPNDSSVVPVTPGEQMPLIDLLYGMMMRSGNDAAMAVAIIVGGSVPNFVNMMNEKAQELGCENTHFANPHGYHDENHYSTARDLATIARFGMQNQTFRDIVGCKQYYMSDTSQRERLKIATTNSMFVQGTFYYEYAEGVKTGFHSKAGQCFVGSAYKDGARVITVTLKTSKNGRWRDSKRLMQYAFTQYRKFTFDDLYAAAPIYATIQNADPNDPGHGMLALTVVPGGELDGYSVMGLAQDIDRLTRDFTGSLSVKYSKQLAAPIYQGDIMGKLTMTLPSGEARSSTVIASRDVKKLEESVTLSDLFPWIDTMNFSVLWIVVALVGLIIALAVGLRIRNAIRINRRRKQMLRRRRDAYDKYRSRR